MSQWPIFISCLAWVSQNLYCWKCTWWEYINTFGYDILFLKLLKFHFEVAVILQVGTSAAQSLGLDCSAINLIHFGVITEFILVSVSHCSMYIQARDCITGAVKNRTACKVSLGEQPADAWVCCPAGVLRFGSAIPLLFSVCVSGHLLRLGLLASLFLSY